MNILWDLNLQILLMFALSFGPVTANAISKRSSSKNACETLITVRGEGGVIKLPEGVTSTAESDLNCQWILVAPENHHILVRATTFNIPKERFTANCDDAWLSLYDKGAESRYSQNAQPSKCGEDMKPVNMRTNLVAIHYVEKTTDFQLKRRSAFTLTWTSYNPQDKLCNKTGLFKCKYSGYCISSDLRCDGVSHCGLRQHVDLGPPSFGVGDRTPPSQDEYEDNSDEECVLEELQSEGFWDENWNVLVCVGAVLTIAAIGSLSFLLRHRALIHARNKRRAALPNLEAMRKRERHFDDPLPPIPPAGSEMGTQSSLNLAKPPSAPEYATLEPYEIINGGKRFVAHFGPPGLAINTQHQMMQQAPPSPQRTNGRGVAPWGGNRGTQGRRSQSSRGSSSPLSSRSAPAQPRHPNNNGFNSSHRLLMSDSNDSDSVFSGSEKGGVMGGAGCRRKHRRDCPNKHHGRHHYNKVRTYSDSRDLHIDVQPQQGGAQMVQTPAHPCVCRKTPPGQQQMMQPPLPNVIPNQEMQLQQQVSFSMANQYSTGMGRSNMDMMGISRSQDFLNQMDPSMCGISYIPNGRPPNQHFRASQGYHSENEQSSRRHKRRGPVMGGSRGYKSETEESISSRSSHVHMTNSQKHMTTSQKAFALLRKQQAQQAAAMNANLMPL